MWAVRGREIPRLDIGDQSITHVEADFSVELGRDDPALEIPGASDGGVRYYDLKRYPELLSNLEESRGFPELGHFLDFINSAVSPLQSAKCDVWFSTDITPEKEMFGTACKFGSYVDLFFSDEGARFLLAEHERLAKHMIGLLRRVPEIPASVEFMIRRCYYHPEGGGDSRAGFYITSYVFGFGDDEDQARQRWAIALKLLENAFRQSFARMEA